MAGQTPAGSSDGGGGGGGGDTAGRERTRSGWALPVGVLMLLVGALGAVLLPNHLATTFTGILVAIAVAGLVLAVSGLVELRRR